MKIKSICVDVPACFVIMLRFECFKEFFIRRGVVVRMYLCFDHYANANLRKVHKLTCIGVLAKKLPVIGARDSMPDHQQGSPRKWAWFCYFCSVRPNCVFVGFKAK